VHFARDDGRITGHLIRFPDRHHNGTSQICPTKKTSFAAIGSSLGNGEAPPKLRSPQSTRGQRPMPADIARTESTLLAAFADLDAASIAGSLLREAGIQCDEGASIAGSEHGIALTGLSATGLARARVILRHAGANEIMEGRDASPRPKSGRPIQFGSEMA